MGTLHIGKRRSRDYGSYYAGRIETEDKYINIALRQSDQTPDTGVAYINVNGWLGPKMSMRTPAIAAAKAGHIGVTFENTNTQARDALERNAQDLTEVITAFSEEGYRLRILALSMGSRTTLQALKAGGSQVESAALTAPAGFYYRDPSKIEVAKGLLGTAPEFMSMGIKYPKQAAYLGVKGLGHFISRARAIGGELIEVLDGNEFDTLREIKQSPTAPIISVHYGSGDRIVPRHIIEHSLPDLPLDGYSMYQGGHGLLVHDPRLAQKIYEYDDWLLSNNDRMQQAA